MANLLRLIFAYITACFTTGVALNEAKYDISIVA